MVLNIVIPMAGLGSRFANAGYTTPKPLIPILGIPMIQLVIRNLQPSVPHRFIFVCQAAHIAECELRPKLEAWAPGCAIVELNGLTEGAACTVLAAQPEMDLESPLMIANADQWVDTDINTYLQAMEELPLDGLIMTMWADDAKWSFVAMENNLVTRVVEKEVISNDATVGIYNFRRAADFVKGAEEMIRRDLRVKNEFYVAPVYNILIEEGYRVGIHDVGREADGMYGLGTPADLDLFLSLPVSKRAVSDFVA
jgi:NDP-sugar pyrophosphorylase family protein